MDPLFIASSKGGKTKWVRLSCGDNRANGVKVREFGDVKVGQLLIVHLTK